MSASSEFVALCRSQVALLTQGLGAALCAIYLTEELLEGATSGLIPIVIYPETAVLRTEDEPWLRLREETSSFFSQRRLPQSASPVIPSAPQEYPTQPQIDSTQKSCEESSLRRQRQIVLPLMHEGVVMGLLVTGREDRPWNEKERLQIERIANTLTIACIMDRRRGWLEQQLEAKQRLQEQQRDLLDDLLHQFRNPMTAIRTFGKLLLRRLRSGDANREVANSIVRESDRLQELLQQFDEAIDMTEADFSRPIVRQRQLASEALEPSENDRSVPLLPDANRSLIAPAQFCFPAEVLKPLLDSALAIASERNLNLVAEIPPLLPVQAPAKALREVLSNLIDNALKYTPAGGQIFIQAGEIRNSPQGVKQQAIVIGDTGPGIPPQDLEHIFERHYRGVQAESKIPGSGLGLAIARDLVEQMQGEIEAISPAVFNWTDQAVSNRSALSNAASRGTTFIVWLPCYLCDR